MHADFAAAIVMGQAALDKMARALYFAGQFDHHLSGTAPSLGNLPSVSFSNFFLDAPFLELSPTNGGKVGLRLFGHGSVTVTPTVAGVPAETRDSHLDITILVNARAVVVGGRLGIFFDATSATVGRLTVLPFGGTSFSTDAQDYLDSAGLRFLMQLAIQVELGRRGSLFQPFDVSFLGAIATDPGTTATLAVVDGGIALGFDVSAMGVTTMGDATQLVNFLDGNDIAMWTNPVALPVMLGRVRTALAAQATANGGTLGALSIILEEGALRVTGSAATDAGGINFNIGLAPVFSRSGTNPERDELIMAIRDIQIDVFRAWWVVLLEVLTVAIAITVVEFLITWIRSNLINAIQLSPGTRISALKQRFFMNGVTEPMISVVINTFECHMEGLFAGMSLDVPFRPARIEGPASVDAEELVGPGVLTTEFRANLGFSALADDPTLRIRWSVRVLGADTVDLVIDELVTARGLVLGVHPAVVPLLAHRFFRVECRLYRVFGGDVEEVRSDAVTIEVTDRLDRTLPYVHWSHKVQVPVVRREADGSTTVLSEVLKMRHSKIHKTALPGRCRMVSRFTQDLQPLGAATGFLDYLDELPFDPLELDQHRAQVCDYCFYGGPTRTVPILP